MKENLILIGILLILLLFLIFCILNRRQKSEEINENRFTEKRIIQEVKEHFNTLIFSKSCKAFGVEEEAKREYQKNELQKAIRTCGYGDRKAKLYVRLHIKVWLVNEYAKTEDELDQIIPFKNNSFLTASDKFDILLYYFEKEYGDKGFIEFVKQCGKTDSTANLTEEDLLRVYEQMSISLCFEDKAEIISQRIYQQYKGHGVIDELRDMEIDGISGGVSGYLSDYDGQNSSYFDGREKLESYNSIWVFLKGNMIRLAFLGFSSQRELERVCKNCYRYDNPGQLSAAKGYIANEMQDGSRVVVVRPPFAEGWSFFIRKFGKSGLSNIEDLITDNNSEIVISLLRFMIEGCQVFGITGEQGCGKTTMLKSLIRFIPPEYTLRIQELLFELHLREMYPERNIVSFRETVGVSGREGLDLQKKTDGTVTIIGEVATAAVAGWLVMISQVASKFSIFTHHAKSTIGLIDSLRNDLMTSVGFHNEQVAENQVRSAIRFDVHMIRRHDGTRCIERITEILRPGHYAEERSSDIIRLTESGYRPVAIISNETISEMQSAMGHDQKREFSAFLEQWKQNGKECGMGG